MSLRDKVISGVMWRIVERFGVRLIHFGVTVVLARLLAPEAFGTVALLSIFISISRVFIEGGLGVALVQKQNVTQEDYCTVFYLNVGVSVAMFMALFGAAPLVAKFYGDETLIWLLRLLSLSILFMAFNCVQNAVLQREMKFRLSCQIGFVESGLTGVCGCFFAWCGLGAWALVIGSVSGVFCGMIVRWVLIKWRPSFAFSWKLARSLYGFGWKVLVTSLMNTSAASAYGVAIGKIHTFSDLAYYNRGHSVPSLVMDPINGAISSVVLPGFSQSQGDSEGFLRMMRGMIQMSMFLVVPLMMGLLVSADSVVLVVFGNQWTPIVPYVRMFALMFALHPLSSILFQGLLARGRSDLSLILEIVKNMLSFAILFLCVNQGPLVLAFMVVVISTPVGVMLNFWPHRKLSGYGLRMLIADIWRPLALSVVMASMTWASARIVDVGVGKLLMQIFVGVACYAVLSWAFHVPQFSMLIKIIRCNAMRICG